MNDLMERPQEEQRFRVAVALSWAAVWAVARHIHALGGRELRIAPYVIRPAFAEREGFGDAGDILVRRIGRDAWARVEVKGRTLEFTGPDDFPFQTIFVERLNRLEKHDPAAAYFVCNRALTNAAVIYGSTRAHWIGPVPFFDSARGHQANAYECPAELAKFIALPVAA